MPKHGKVAVVGSGIAGLSCAYTLARAGVAVSLIEAGEHYGGHSNTVDVTLDGRSHGVDTGFLVFNHKTYPNLVRLFAELGVQTAPSEMSFSVKTPVAGRLGSRMLEWSGDNLNTVFGQRRNLLERRFWHMLGDIMRFNREATALADAPDHPDCAMALGAFLEARGYSTQFRDWYLLPMAGCIWSCPVRQMLEFPVSTFTRFCANHGLLQIDNRPQWHTVAGGSRHYVDKMLAAIPDKRDKVAVQAVARTRRGVLVQTADGTETYDQVVLACHSDQSARLLIDATPLERALLAAIPYQPNRAVLHTDTRCLPQRHRLWAAWNYESRPGKEAQVCVHYLLNKLQPLPFATPLIVSLNPIDAPDPAKVLAEFDYSHPVFNHAAVAAQARLEQVQGKDGIWFAGAWTGYGFHEDGLRSGLNVAHALFDFERRISLPSAA